MRPIPYRGLIAPMPMNHAPLTLLLLPYGVLRVEPPLVGLRGHIITTLTMRDGGWG